MGTFQDLREIVKRLKHRNETRKFCPVCGSARLKLAGGSDFWLTPGKFVCQDCGYRGFIVMEKEENVSRKDDVGKTVVAGEKAGSDDAKEGF